MPGSTTPQNLDKLMHELDNVLKERGTTRARVQRQLGWGNSRISDLKANPSPLKISDLLGILSVVGMDPPEFMERVHGRAELPAELEEIHQAIETLFEKLGALSEPGRQAPPPARRIARAITMLLRPLTKALRANASAPAIEAAWAETATMALFLCTRRGRPDKP